MSKHVWLLGSFNRHTVDRGAYAYCLARNGGVDPYQVNEQFTTGSRMSPLEACRFAGYAVETIRQEGGGHRASLYLSRVRLIWAGVVRSKYRYAKGVNQDNYELAGRRLLAAAVRLVFGRFHHGPDETLGGLLYRLEEDGGVIPVLHDYLEENGYGECLDMLVGNFRGVIHAATTPRSEEGTDPQDPEGSPGAGNP